MNRLSAPARWSASSRLNGTGFGTPLMSAPGRTVTPSFSTAYVRSTPFLATDGSSPALRSVEMPARMQLVSGDADAAPAVDRIAVEASAAAAATGRILMCDSFVCPECPWFVEGSTHPNLTPPAQVVKGSSKVVRRPAHGP